MQKLVVTGSVYKGIWNIVHEGARMCPTLLDITKSSSILLKTLIGKPLHQIIYAIIQSANDVAGINI